MDKTKNVNFYNISILYETMFSMFCTLVFYNAFGAKIVHTITWRMAFFNSTKPGDNLEFLWLKKLETLPT